MFTGIVTNRYPVIGLERTKDSCRLTLKLDDDLVRGLAVGASVSVSGVCLSAVAVDGISASFNLMGETLKKTTLGTIRESGFVNIERSARFGDEIGGHLMSGHVVGMANIRKIEQSPNNWIVHLAADPAWMECILPKGFIGLDGCSLTVVDVEPDGFSVHLIPETLKRTTFGLKKEGDFVNVELDSQTQAAVETVKRFLLQKAQTAEEQL